MPKLIVALDGLADDRMIHICKSLRDLVWGFKVNDLLTLRGAGVVQSLKRHGHVFADPKFYDIPNTVANCVRHLDDAGADFISIHCTGGPEMMKAARWSAKRAKLLGVTILTAMNNDSVFSVYNTTFDLAIRKLAESAERCLLDGIVCPAESLESLKHLKLVKVVPGIRPEGSPKDDQVRTSATADADYIVVGRPITQAEDPIAAATFFLEHNGK